MAGCAGARCAEGNLFGCICIHKEGSTIGTYLQLETVAAVDLVPTEHAGLGKVGYFRLAQVWFHGLTCQELACTGMLLECISDLVSSETNPVFSKSKLKHSKWGKLEDLF